MRSEAPWEEGQRLIQVLGFDLGAGRERWRQLGEQRAPCPGKRVRTGLVLGVSPGATEPGAMMRPSWFTSQGWPLTWVPHASGTAPCHSLQCSSPTSILGNAGKRIKTDMY